MRYQCTVDQRKQEVTAFLTESNLSFELIGENKIKIFGKSDIYGEFLPTGHLYLEKYSRRLKRMVHKWPCGGMQAIATYLKQHA